MIERQLRAKIAEQEAEISILRHRMARLESCIVSQCLDIAMREKINENHNDRDMISLAGHNAYNDCQVTEKIDECQEKKMASENKE